MSKHQIEHMEFELTFSDKDGAWFIVRVPNEKPALFSGPINVGMASQVKKLHKAIKDIEEKITDHCEHCHGEGWIEVEEMVRVAGEYQAYEPVGRNERCDYCNPLGI